jgi:hypothetical protein
MPTVAERTDDSELVMVVDADKSSGFACPDCGADVSHVKGHERAGDWYQQHFRYRTCGCYGKTPEDPTARGGGSGESTLHKTRKLEALNYATNKYESASHDTEVWIGEKRADAVLQFDSPDDEYGLGFAIEYQHKNEDKDLDQTETEYAQNGYTTLWLWESEFNHTDQNRPEVNLFDGRVCKPYPKGVPEPKQWMQGALTVDHLLKHWRDERCGRIEVTIHSDWFEMMPSKRFRSFEWVDLFRDHPWYKAKRYIRRARPLNDVRVPPIKATFYNHWGEPPNFHRADSDIDPPDNVFDDVQCRDCTHYIHYTEAPKFCKTCGTEFDLWWNLKTGRISNTAYGHLKKRHETEN